MHVVNGCLWQEQAFKMPVFENARSKGCLEFGSRHPGDKLLYDGC
jgi:hypothetical protein